MHYQLKQKNGFSFLNNLSDKDKEVLIIQCLKLKCSGLATSASVEICKCPRAVAVASL